MAGRDANGRFIKGQPSWNKGLHICLGGGWPKGKPSLSKGKHIQTNTGRTHIKKGQRLSPKTEFKKGQTSWREGKKFPELSGINHHNWKGGISPLRNKIMGTFEYRQWRSDIFTRDKFTCQKCNQEGGDLEAHHVISFNSLIRKHEITMVKQALTCAELWNINNGLTLCVDCHKKTDNFGLKPRKRQMWQDA